MPLGTNEETRLTTVTTHNSAEVEATTPRPHPARHRRLLFIGCLLTILVAGGIVLRRAQDATALRESYLPELEARAKREPNYGQLQALTAGRLTEANEYASAVPYLERAVRAGENEEIVWRTWAAAIAASGNREQAGVILLAAKKAVVHFSEIEAAIQRCRTLPADTSVEKLAETICPEGVRGLVSHYNQGSFLNDWSEKSGRNNPETSGFETRHAWAKEKPNDAQALRYWGEALIRNRRNVEAESVLRHTLELDPTSLDARIALANALKARGEYGKAGLEYILSQKEKRLAPRFDGLGTGCTRKANAFYWN